MRIKKNCLTCDKEISVIPSLNKIKKFCSRVCKEKWQTIHLSGFNSPKNRRKVVKCSYCNKEFVARGHRLDRGQGRFCSLKCWGIWSRIHIPKKNTDIENIIRGKLLEGKIAFKEQQPIGRIAVVDFLIQGKVVVNVDGDYWHSLPKMIEKDKRQNQLLKEMGYTVLRLWGSEIKKDPDYCLKKIKDNIGI